MNTKAAIGIIAAIIILVAAFFVLNHKTAEPVLTPTMATSTEATTTSSTGSVPAVAPATTGSQGPTVTSVRTSDFDDASLVSNLPRPVITGTANVSSVGLVITNSQGVGIAGSYEIPVTKGHWSYSAPQTLAPGKYTLSLIDGGDILNATLVVNKP